MNEVIKLNPKKNNDKNNNKTKKDELNNYLVNENILKNLLILKKGKNYKILKNSKSIKEEKTKGRLSTSPKTENFFKNNSNKSNINLDILRKLKKNYSNNIMDNYNMNIRINQNSKIYIKKIAKNNNNRDSNSFFDTMKINTTISAKNKKIDFLKNNKMNEEIKDYIQNKNKFNCKEFFDIFKNDKNKSKGIEKNKNIVIKLKNKTNNNLDDKYKNINNKNKLKKLRCFISFCPKTNENKIFKNINNEQYVNYSSIVNNFNAKHRNNMTNNNSELFNKSIDSKRIYEVPNKCRYKLKQRRNLSTDIDYISNSIPYKINKIQEQNELKEHYLYNIIKKKEAFSNRNQNKAFNNLKNNSKFSLRNNLLYDNTLIIKTNKSIDKNNLRSKYDIKSLFEKHHIKNSVKKMNKDNIIYKKIMKNFYKNARNNYQNTYEKNIKTRRTEYKQNNINYNISNNINNNINNININTSNNLINLITNITTSNDDFQSLSGKKTYIRHNLTNSLIQNQKYKKEIDSQIIDNIFRLSEVNTHYNKKNYTEKNNNTKKKCIKNNNNNNYKKLDKKILYSFSTQNNKNINIIKKNNDNNKNIIRKMNENNFGSHSFLQNNNCRKEIKKYIIDKNSNGKKFKISYLNSERNNYKVKNSIKNNYINNNINNNYKNRKV